MAEPETGRDDQQQRVDHHAPADAFERDREHAGAGERRDHDRQDRRSGQLDDLPHHEVGQREVRQAVHAAERQRLQLREPRAVGRDQRRVRQQDTPIGIH